MFLMAYNVSLDIYVKNLALLVRLKMIYDCTCCLINEMQRTFVRTASSSRAKENTYKEFGKWITEVFNDDPTAEELDDIAAHDSDFDYVSVSVSAAPCAAVSTSANSEEQ